MNIGDQVVWFEHRENRNGIEVVKRSGTIKAVTGDIATITTIGNGQVKRNVRLLTLKSQDTLDSIFDEALSLIQKG